MTPSDIKLHAGPSNGKGHRLVIAQYGEDSHRGEFNTNSATSRRRFFGELSQKTTIPVDDLVRQLDNHLVAAADDAHAQATVDGAQLDGGDDGDRKDSQATILIKLAMQAELWHTPDGDAYATIAVDEHRENWPVRSRGFKRWLARRYYETVGAACNSQATADALTAIEGEAIYNGPEHAIYTRLAQREDNIYLDLCNGTWQTVEITAAGWNVVDDPPVRFKRAKAMMALPYPVAGGAIAELRELVNVTPEDWPLVVAWLLAALRPTGPYPVLCVHGEQGSAKSTTARVLRALVDPNTAPLRCEPREPRDLMIQANNGWIIALDNLSRLPTWLSDAICRLSTGGGFSTRTLYENDEETIFDAMRPTVMTGIEELAVRGDLLDRALLVNLPTIPDDRRRHERDFWADFERRQPKLLGAMLTAVSTALANMPQTHLDRLPRMADFALWTTAAEPALEMVTGTFMAAYTGNRAAGNELAIEASPVGKAVVEMMVGTSWWENTPSALLEELEQAAGEKTTRLKVWPKTARGLSGILKRLAPNLRALGIDVDSGHRGRGREKRNTIIIRRTGESCDPSDPIDPNTEKQRSGGVDGGANGPSGVAVGSQPGDAVSPCQTTVGAHGGDGGAEIRPYSAGADGSGLSAEDEAELDDFLQR